MPERNPLTPEEIEAESGSVIPDKEVLSLLDLFVNADIALDLAAPIDLAVAANANAALPIDASVTANVLSTGSTAEALAAQGVAIDQSISADAIAYAPQDATIDQSDDVVGEGTEAPVAETGSTGGTQAVDPVTGELVDIPVDSLLADGLLNVDVNVALDADLTAPVAGAVAANANVAAPIDASVAANVASVSSSATAIADQTAIINQSIEGTAQATADQDAEIIQ